MSDDQDRAERLRERRNRTRERPRGTEGDEQAETDETADQAEQTQPSKPSERSEPSKPDKESVKDEQVGTYMYLPEDQADELTYQFDRLKAEYRRETGEELQKNRHFYPLVVQHGLESLDDWDGSDIKEKVDELGG